MILYLLVTNYKIKLKFLNFKKKTGFKVEQKRKR